MTPILPDPTAVLREPLSSEDRLIIWALSNCTFLPGTTDKRIVRQALAWATIGPKGRDCIDRLRWKYRKQIPATVPFRFIPS